MKISLRIGGEAGQGIKSSGLMLAKLALRSGFHTYNYTEYPSLIRGGHNSVQVNICSEEVFGPKKKTDFLIALNKETIDRHLDELNPGGSILYEEKDGQNTFKKERKLNFFPVPLLKLAAQAGGGNLLANTASLGALTALLGGDLRIFQNLISEEFLNKDPKVSQVNKQAAQLGYDFALEHFKDTLKKTLAKTKNVLPKIVINGNDAVALGAIAGGLEFAAIYPMSPISSILQTLALYQEKYCFVYKQPEDEIAGINMAIGASFAGARSMVATSGGGFCLMTEGYGLAGMTETPLVIIEGQRPGPATGLPTWSGQGDLGFILHAHQGDFPRIVLAGGDAKEAFDLTKQAFNLADKYQTPVIVILDKNICEDEQSFPVFDLSSYSIDRGKLTTKKLPNYQRFALEDDGVSVRTLPGTGNFFIANSYEHDQTGFSSEEIKDVNNQMNKRMNKLKSAALQDMPDPKLFGPKEADITFVSWGSNKGPILEAMKNFPNVNYLHLTWLSPFPAEAINQILSKAHHIISVECNYFGQLACLIREKTGLEITDKLLKIDGRPFFTEEISGKIKSVLKR